ncbi:hypothetical protein BO71DRAFT_400979 [Aspergillus ellipticus CBS 707.79]|uniref:F-box domain-containing protein n=1 Tax=Aspergillus ellipticus CBS 707.79 TaxID=1448320 RepID=A0A319D381_9EURO|nr:hypothetical protein BO71DRAFT_400979 [Aspergillus ellipticus CBS 707.79]
MEHLPAEILLLVANQFDFIRPAQKCNLLQVCRRWRSILLSTVYEQILVRKSRLPALMRATHDNPAIRSSIKLLRILSCWKGRDKHPDTTPFIPLIKHISQSPEEFAQWQAGLEKANGTDAWIGLLLVSLENLTSLSMTWPNNANLVTQIVSRAATREAPFDTKPVLQHLEDFDLDFLDHKDWHAHQQFFPFFRLPAMRTLRLESVIECMPQRDTAFQPPPGTSPIVSLAFGRFSNGSKGMAEYITACANLECFDYQHCHQAIWSSSNIEFRPRTFYRALTTQKHSLQVLHLNDRGEHENLDIGADDDSDDETDDFAENFFGSLAGFSKLWDLRIPVANLLSFHLDPSVTSLKEILPPGLKLLHLADFNITQLSLLLSNLLDVVASRGEMFPLLERLEIQTNLVELVPQPEGPSWTLTQAFTPLSEACEAAGIQMEIVRGRRRRM